MKDFNEDGMGRVASQREREDSVEDEIGVMK